MGNKHTMSAIFYGTIINKLHSKNQSWIMFIQITSISKRILDNLEMVKEGVFQQFLIKHHIIAMFEDFQLLSFGFQQVPEKLFQILEIYFFVSFLWCDNQNLRIRITNTNVFIGELFAQSFKSFRIFHSSSMF